MSHPLEQKLVALRRRVRWLSILYAVSILGATLLGAATILGSLDYVIRFEDRGLRVICSAMVLGAVLYALYRYAIRTLVVPLRDADLAVRVERRFPILGDGLISAVEFLRGREGDATAGSWALRRAVVDRITAVTQRIDFREAIDRRTPYRAAAAFAMLGVVAGLLLIADPLAARTAVARLTNPFGNAVWPRLNHLAIRNAPERVARGQAFRVEVVDAEGASLPTDMRIHYRLDPLDVAGIAETQRMSVDHAVAVAKRESVLQPFSYRVEGGDDQTLPWMHVSVADAPSVASVMIEITPPAYTHGPVLRAKQRIRALTGSEVRVTVKATKPLQSAAVRIDGAEDVAARLDDSGAGFTASFRVERSGSYGFELVDGEGLAGSSDRWAIEAVADAPPKVRIDSPASDLVVTPQAAIPVRVAASDDLGLRDIAIVFDRGDRGAEERIAVWNRPGPPGPGGGNESNAADRRTVEYRWELESLNLEPLSRIVFHALATDDLGQRGQSGSRTLSVVTTEELRAHVAAGEKDLRRQVQRALAAEQACYRQVELLAKSVKERKRIGLAEVNLLRAAYYSQTDVERALTSRRDGIPVVISVLLDDLENNHMQDDAAGQRLSELLRDIETLESRHLPVVARELLSASKMGQSILDEQGKAEHVADDIGRALDAARTEQDSIIASLEQILGRLEASDDVRRAMSDLATLRGEQAAVSDRTMEVGRRTLTQNLRDLARQDIAELQNVAGRQRDLARTLDRVLQDLERIQPEVEAGASSGSLAEGAALARQLAIGSRMRSVSQRIEENHVGQATAGQKQIVADLDRMLGVLSQSHSGSDAKSGAESVSHMAAEAKPPESHTQEATGPPTSELGKEQRGRQAASGAAGTAPDEPSRGHTAEQRRMLMSRLWGELPSHARQQLLQTPVEEFPPKYESQIEEYFRRLAEEK